VCVAVRGQHRKWELNSSFLSFLWKSSENENEYGVAGEQECETELLHGEWQGMAIGIPNPANLHTGLLLCGHLAQASTCAVNSLYKL